MRVIWRPIAKDDLAQIHAFIAKDDPSTAEAIVHRIIAASRLLEDHPGAGRAGRVSRTRELVVSGTPYILPYWQLSPSEVEILAVIHGSMRWPADFP
ncbi:MAG: type II toxin-antitoxin system RelE/ParE family toxin [Rhodospirillales bacterium]|nr:type II toxin-antitoxin system RelE/ParE family toxin [Rhodospirillales bacterium]